MDASPPSKVCSFCGRPGTRDTTYACGLGALICSDCLTHHYEAMTSGALSGPVSPRPWDELSDEEALAMLPAVVRSADQADEFVGDWIHMLRGRKIAWAAIGKTLGVTRQAVWAKHGRRDASG